MQKSKNIFLIGPMGSGKSALGKILAERLDMKFYDTDVLIEESCGADIAWIFDIEGEEGFRKRETKILQEFAESENIILATGGGAILKPENREFLKQKGWCVFINLDINEQWRRLKNTKDRPLLMTKDARSKLEQINKSRLELYLEVADFQIESQKDRQAYIAQTIQTEFLKNQHS